MKVDPKPLVIPNKDETYSHSGLKDFEKPEQGDVRTIPSPPNNARRPRTRASINNSYT